MFNKKQLERFFSNSDKNIFVLINMPDVLKGALFSRYSRSPKPLRQLFLDEYLNEAELSPEDKLNGTAEAGEGVLQTEKAKNFYRKWLAMYGDDSIAELAGIHMGIENISMIAAKFIEDRRVGISPLEKSTRYVRFDDKENGEYKYYKDAELLKSRYGKLYTRTMNGLFDTYSELMQPMMDYFIKKFPKPAEVSDSAYATSIKAKACDTLRGLLPLGTLTNIGIFANGRSIEYLITRLKARSLPEFQDIADQLLTESKKYIENFVERIESEKGQKYIEYLAATEEDLSKLSQEKVSHYKSAHSGVKMTGYEKDGEMRIAAQILYPYSNMPYEEVLKSVKKMPRSKINKIILRFGQNRNGRWHKIGKAFEDIYYSFEIVSDFGAYKDLQRHRMLTLTRQKFTTRNGYEVPHDIIEAGFEKNYRKAMESANEAYMKIHDKFPGQAQYVVCHGNLLRWHIKLNLREAFHLCELRSSPQGHPSYRKIAQDIYKAIKKVHPTVGETMKYVNMQEPGLERLSAEVRKEEKLNAISKK